jgi:hypothetical protein
MFPEVGSHAVSVGNNNELDIKIKYRIEIKLSDWPELKRKLNGLRGS